MAFSSDTELCSESAHDITYMTSLGLESNINTAGSDKIFYCCRSLEQSSDSNPILVLIHGYPQSNFMWRHIIPLLPPQIPLFIPDIPGYGRSSPLSTPHSKLNTGLSILTALHALLSPTSTHGIILAGHNRGAHISQRLTVSNPHPSFKILGTILLDITPSLTRWSSFGSPSTAVGGFHWPFLVNVSLATSMINALGGDVWARFCLERWSGNSTSALSKFKENNAWEVYMSDFKHESVVQASCDDYRAGAEEDVVMQEEDQRQGRKMNCPVLKVYSELFLGEKYDMRAVWEEFMGKAELELVGIGGGVGHFVAEEAPEETAEAMVRFYERVA
ncbi:putative Fluoroacetate dehalogenase [Leptodontidium sp. MPI-SDFR-AT-0119]|nr:putative Fluoroacetate dehalogenase [Leptodontidium sp. MPI-SDFR-AT-0119]